MSTNPASVVAARSVPAGRGWEWIVEAWTLTAGYRLLFTGLVFGFIAAAVAANILPFVGAILMGFMAPLFQAGLILGCDAMRRGEPLKLDHLFAGFELQTGRLLALGGVSVAAGIVMTLIGAAIIGVETLTPLVSGVPPALDQAAEIFMRVLLAILVILALSVPVFMAMWFAVPLITLRGVGVGAAMSLSFSGCLKNMLPFLVWSVAYLALAIAAALPVFAATAIHLSLALVFASVPLLLLAGLVLMALYFASMYTSYLDVFAVANEITPAT